MMHLLLAMARREIAAGTKLIVIDGEQLITEAEAEKRIARMPVGHLTIPDPLGPTKDPTLMQRLAAQFPEPQNPNRAQRRAKR